MVLVISFSTLILMMMVYVTIGELISFKFLLKQDLSWHVLFWYLKNYLAFLIVTFLAEPLLITG